MSIIERVSAGGLSNCKLHSLGVQIVVLYVEADESIKRQLLRARQASLHNRCYVRPHPVLFIEGVVSLLQNSDASKRHLLMICLNGQAHLCQGLKLRT